MIIYAAELYRDFRLMNTMRNYIKKMRFIIYRGFIVKLLLYYLFL